MTPFEAYKTFLAVKMHFTQPQYDFFKYQGKVNAKIQTFETRRDKYHFAKLSKLKDPVGYLVAQYISGDFTGWVGDCFTEEAGRRYTQYLARQQSLTYNFDNELGRITEDFPEYFKVKDGQHPLLLTLHRRGFISIETLTILNNHLKFFPIWDNKIDDPVLWPAIRSRCLKYKPFISYDKVKIKEKIHEVLAACTPK